jgi:hypothetical protein
MVVVDLPPRCRDLLRHLAKQPQPFHYDDTVLPPGGLTAWASAFHMLWSAGTLERVCWGVAPRFQLKNSAARALGGLTPRGDA